MVHLQLDRILPMAVSEALLRHFVAATAEDVVPTFATDLELMTGPDHGVVREDGKNAIAQLTHATSIAERDSATITSERMFVIETTVEMSAIRIQDEQSLHSASKRNRPPSLVARLRN